MNYKNHRGQICAHFDGAVLRKTISKSKHLLDTPLAIGFDEDIIEDVKARGGSKVIVTEREEGIDYHALISDFYKTNKVVRIDRGHKTQLALLLDAWIKTPVGKWPPRQGTLF